MNPTNPDIDSFRQQTFTIDLLYDNNSNKLDVHLATLRKQRGGGPLPKMTGEKLFGLVFDLRCQEAAIRITRKDISEYIKTERWRNAGSAEQYQYKLYAKDANDEDDNKYRKTYDPNEPLININNPNGGGFSSFSGMNSTDNFFNGSNSAIN
ncbi:17013_t:CDS:1 [Dentiscutata erythropus]|uniref:17013_t:CDS:1 n=1 Tax=Dentiscutata erythropus TaxID=1348616 RepID=A0A9N9EZY6_9GLOM|nr:17013_t:CDS:1 [Dentiscutata erythropus]